LEETDVRVRSAAADVSGRRPAQDGQRAGHSDGHRTEGLVPARSRRRADISIHGDGRRLQSAGSTATNSAVRIP